MEMTESEYNRVVLKKINDFMKKNNINQSQLAKKSNINQSTLSKIMNGEIKLTLQHIFKICKALEIDPEILLSFNEEIVNDGTHVIDSGIINKKYIDDQILIRNTIHPAFKGYIGNTFYIYSYSTISSETSLLEGKLLFEDTEFHNFCKSTMILFTGKTDSNNDKVTKKYYGELIISLTMGACYVILVNSEIGELCTINFKHTFLFNQELVCRVGTISSTSSGTSRLPVIQRLLISDRKLKVSSALGKSEHEDDRDISFVRGQLKLNNSDIILTDNSFSKIKDYNNKSKELNDFFLECLKTENKYWESFSYYIFDETKIRSIDAKADIKAQGISILRDYSIASKYNKVSNKTEEFAFQYISNLGKSSEPMS